MNFETKQGLYDFAGRQTERDLTGLVALGLIVAAVVFVGFLFAVERTILGVTIRQLFAAVQR